MSARYRKIDVRIWNDEKFRFLSDDSKLVFLFLLTHPGMTSLGAMRATLSGLAEELSWNAKKFRKALAEVIEKGMVEHDEKSLFICLPNFLKYNTPESPNVVKSWEKQFDLLPECDLKEQQIERARIALGKQGPAYAEALPEAFRKPSPKPSESAALILNLSLNSSMNLNPTPKSPKGNSAPKNRSSSGRQGFGINPEILEDTEGLMVWFKDHAAAIRRDPESHIAQREILSVAEESIASGEKRGGLFIHLVKQLVAGQAPSISAAAEDRAKVRHAEWIRSRNGPAHPEVANLAMTFSANGRA